ncbi:MAG: hypothetical protein K8R23_07050 [Chthoniobacter sp.]|nr:hypothetical protein [Chthoniobacter sp.]
MQAFLRAVAFAFGISGMGLAADVSTAINDPNAVPTLIKALDSEDKATVVAAFIALNEYYCGITVWLGEQPEFDREGFKKQAISWSKRYSGMTRKEIVVARVNEQPDSSHTLHYVAKVFPSDEALDFLIAWCQRDRGRAYWGLYELRQLMGIDMFGGHEPNEHSFVFAIAYWTKVKLLGHDDRLRLMAIGRLLRDPVGFAGKLSESQARKIFLESEDRSLELWQQLYDLQPAWGNTLREDAVYRAGTVASHQFSLLNALARVNSPKCVTVVKQAAKEHSSSWLKGATANLLYNLGRYPYVVMEAPVPGR